MSRFDKYRSNGGDDWPELRKLQPGETFTAKLTGDHEFQPEPTKDDPDPDPLPVLEFNEGDVSGSAPFGWMASAWQARDELAIADPPVGSMVKVARLANRGRSHQYEVTVVRSANGDKPTDADVPIDTAGLDKKFGDKAPW